MASSQSYGDFERDYNAHLSKVRAFLAQPTTNLNTPQQAANVGQCEKALQEAKQCIHAMTGLAEIEGDPFKSEDAKRKLERDIGPLEEEIRSRKAAGWKQSSGWGATNSTSDQKKLFGIKRSYAPPSMGGDNDVEYGDMSLTAPLTEVERRMRDSEHLLRESQA
ncbi:hypothetical protein HJC23_004219 [Cyclotella cryptica]|uniref:Vesicle transport v-SNARE N-terminal domain-containing protein n=1 Tax=Cyclotella cryptica TaxID=29204 RepID=A0ABD3Q7Q6_9STRA